MNILITGGFGLIGRNLVSELSNNNNFNIFLISRNNKPENTIQNIVIIDHDLLAPIPDVMGINCLLTKMFKSNTYE